MDWRKAVERLAGSDAGFRAAIDHAPDGVAIFCEHRIVYGNAALQEMLGWAPTDVIGRPALDLVHPDDQPLVAGHMERLHAGTPGSPFISVRLLRPDGSVLETSAAGMRVEIEGAPCVVVVCRDMTEQRLLEARLVESDRMAALGTLSAGIAHEINNPLTYLMLHIDAAAALVNRIRTGDGGDPRALLDRLGAAITTAQDGARRVRDIVRDLRVYARPSEERREPVDVQGTLERALAMTAHELRRRATVVTDLRDVPRVLADEGRLTQVFVNLFINAAHALGEGDPMRHRVEVRLWPVGGARGDVRVSIHDTGPGIPADALPHIFEPFFTTKPVGEGTGLGLAIVHRIVTSLGGRIAARNEPAGGATFTVELPAAP